MRKYDLRPPVSGPNPTGKTGVYCILNTVTGKRYVGSAAKSIKQRWAVHRSELKLRRHHSIRLQNSWNLRGAHAFEFTVLCSCSPEWCLAMEQFYINKYQSSLPSLGYNINPTAGSALGVKMTPEQCAANSARQKGRKLSPEAHARLIAERQTRVYSDEFKDKARSTLNRPDVRARAADGIRRYWANPNPEHVRKMNASKQTDSFRKKISEWHRTHPKSPEHLAKLSAITTARNKQPMSDATRAKMRTSAQRRHADPAQRAKMRAIGEIGRASRAANKIK